MSKIKKGDKDMEVYSFVIDKWEGITRVIKTENKSRCL